MDKLPIDYIGNFFQTRPQGFGSMSVVAQRMIEAMTAGCDLRAYNTGGNMWMHLDRADADKVDPKVFLALRRGRKENGDEGIRENHICLFHGHPVFHDSRTNRYNRGVHPLVDRYRFKVLMTVCESEPLPIEWIEQARIFDLIAVPSNYCKRVWDASLKACRVKIPVVVVPHGVEDMFKPLPDGGKGAKSGTLRSLEQDKRFKLLTMYTALSFPHRKGIDKAIEAYCTEFKPDDPVVFVIRTENKPYLDEMIARYDTHPDILIIDEPLVLQDLPKLYNLASCYVLPSRGEAWGLDLSNAIGCGLPSISTRYSGMLDYAEGYTNWVGIEKDLVPGTCYANVSGLYAEPDLVSLRKAMRSVFEGGKKARQASIKASSQFHHDWSWTKAGEKCIEEIGKVFTAKYGTSGLEVMEKRNIPGFKEARK